MKSNFKFYILKRLLFSVPLLLVITGLSFLLMNLAPGDPADMFLDPRASHQDILQLRHNLGLDQPVYIQYVKWLVRICQGDFGYSYVSSKPVLTAILERLPATLLLSISALICIVTFTFILGIISALKKGRFIDDLIMILTLVGLSVPAFWLGVMLIFMFAIQLNWFPTSGMQDPMLVSAPMFVRVMDVFRHLFLPLLTIVIGGMAGLTRYHRFGMIRILSEPYIIAVQARGVSQWRVVFLHAFKNAALPVITILGLSLPELIGGAFVIEYIFSWPGMGQLGVAAVFARDYPILMGSILFSSVLIIAGNFLADLAYAWSDPRIRCRG